MLPTFKVPVDGKDIPYLLKEVRDELKRIRAEESSALALLEVIRAYCSHSSKSYDNDVRGSSTECNICGKVW